MIFQDVTLIILTDDHNVENCQNLCSMTHCGLSSAVVQVMCADDEEEADTTIEQAQMVQERLCRRQALEELLRTCLRELWCAAQDLDWAGSAVRGHAGGKRKRMQNGRDRRARNDLLRESRRRFLCIIIDLIDGNASASIYTNCEQATSRKQHFW